MPDRETIALLGTGTMGTGMGRNLLAAGFPVRAWNRTFARATPLAEAGATVVESPAAAATGATVVLTMLADGSAVDAAMNGPDGALPVLGEGCMWVQSSTIGVDDSERFAGLARDHGVEFVDAPVLGSKVPAERGDLTVLGSGPESVRARCAPIFDAIGSRTIWAGEGGAGTRLKLVVNTWVNGLVGVLAETIALARALKMDPELFLHTIDGSPQGSPYASMKGELMIRRKYPTSFAAALAGKDVRLAREVAAANSVDLPLSGALANLYREAVERGLGDEDNSVIHEIIAPPE
jgi:3-hydroxyisobutyrate dehydrogenase